MRVYVSLVSARRAGRTSINNCASASPLPGVTKRERGGPRGSRCRFLSDRDIESKRNSRSSNSPTINRIGRRGARRGGGFTGVSSLIWETRDRPKIEAPILIGISWPVVGRRVQKSRSSLASCATPIKPNRGPNLLGRVTSR